MIAETMMRVIEILSDLKFEEDIILDDPSSTLLRFVVLNVALEIYSLQFLVFQSAYQSTQFG